MARSGSAELQPSSGECIPSAEHIAECADVLNTSEGDTGSGEEAITRAPKLLDAGEPGSEALGGELHPDDRGVEEMLDVCTRVPGFDVPDGPAFTLTLDAPGAGMGATSLLLGEERHGSWPSKLGADVSCKRSSDEAWSVPEEGLDPGGTSFLTTGGRKSLVRG